MAIKAEPTSDLMPQHTVVWAVIQLFFLCDAHTPTVLLSCQSLFCSQAHRTLSFPTCFQSLHFTLPCPAPVWLLRQVALLSSTCTHPQNLQRPAWVAMRPVCSISGVCRCRYYQLWRVWSWVCNAGGASCLCLPHIVRRHTLSHADRAIMRVESF